MVSLDRLDDWSAHPQGRSDANHRLGQHALARTNQKKSLDDAFPLAEMLRRTLPGGPLASHGSKISQWDPESFGWLPSQIAISDEHSSTIRHPASKRLDWDLDRPVELHFGLRRLSDGAPEGPRLAQRNPRIQRSGLQRRTLIFAPYHPRRSPLRPFSSARHSSRTCPGDYQPSLRP
jgi:hypothetical protein